MSDLVLTEDHGRVRHVVLNRPDKRNAFNFELIDALDGALQDAALRALDRAACRYGSSREELALALVEPAAAREYKREHGVDPRSAGGLLQGLLALSPPG